MFRWKKSQIEHEPKVEKQQKEADMLLAEARVGFKKATELLDEYAAMENLRGTS